MTTPQQRRALQAQEIDRLIAAEKKRSYAADIAAEKAEAEKARLLSDPQALRKAIFEGCCAIYENELEKQCKQEYAQTSRLFRLKSNVLEKMAQIAGESALAPKSSKQVFCFPREEDIKKLHKNMGNDAQFLGWIRIIKVGADNQIQRDANGYPIVITAEEARRKLRMLAK